MTQLKPDVPRHLGRIVAHCLEKEPQDRVQSARDVRNELRGLRKEVESGVSQITATPEPTRTRTAAGGRGKRLWIGLTGAAVIIAALVLILGRGGQTPEQDVTATPPPESTTPAPEPHSIAVLPFVNMSEDAANEYFSEGVSEELLNLLAKIPQLRVTSRSSAFSFKGKDLEIPEIARRLNVAHILEGSVRKAGNQVRITAQLIEAGSDTHQWSQTYDRTLDDIFAIQDEIAADVVAQLKVALLGEVPKVRVTDPEAYALYLQGRHLAILGTPEGYEKAIESPDGLRSDNSAASLRVHRGGGFLNPAPIARSAFRSRLHPEDRNSGLGLRPSRKITN